MKKIAVHLAKGFEEIEAVTIIDVLRRAGFEVVVISVTGEKAVEGSHQIIIIADQLIDQADYNQIDMIVLPGGMPGARNLSNHDLLNQQILEFNKQQKPLAAVCAAPMVLGKLGILKNKTATCYPGFEEHLKGAHITSEDVETDGHIITGRGAGVALKFALKIVEYLQGSSASGKLAEKMVYSG